MSSCLPLTLRRRACSPLSQLVLGVGLTGLGLYLLDIGTDAMAAYKVGLHKVFFFSSPAN